MLKFLLYQNENRFFVACHKPVLDGFDQDYQASVHCSKQSRQLTSQQLQNFLWKKFGNAGIDFQNLLTPFFNATEFSKAFVLIFWFIGIKSRIKSTCDCSKIKISLFDTLHILSWSTKSGLNWTVRQFMIGGHKFYQSKFHYNKPMMAFTKILLAFASSCISPVPI